MLVLLQYVDRCIEKQKHAASPRPNHTKALVHEHIRRTTTATWPTPSPRSPPSVLPVPPCHPLTLVEISGYGTIYRVSSEGQHIAQEAAPRRHEDGSSSNSSSSGIANERCFGGKGQIKKGKKAGNGGTTHGRMCTGVCPENVPRGSRYHSFLCTLHVTENWFWNYFTNRSLYFRNAPRERFGEPFEEKSANLCA